MHINRFLCFLGTPDISIPLYSLSYEGDSMGALMKDDHVSPIKAFPLYS